MCAPIGPKSTHEPVPRLCNALEGVKSSESPGKERRLNADAWAMDELKAGFDLAHATHSVVRSALF